MAQQQQTVLRVQTNIPDNTITIQSGYTSVNTGDTFNISYSGTGTSDDPYIGSSTGSAGSTSAFNFTINDRDGILYYQYSGTSTLFLSINGNTVRFNSNANISGNVNVYQGNVIEFNAQAPAQLIGMYFVANEDVIYKNEFLDLYGDIPIKINKSFAELQDISKRNSDYSIGLQLPGSKKNNRFFESFFNVDVDTLYFNPLTRVPCSVMIDDQSYFSGYLKLNKISIMNSKVEYDVTLFSSVGDLYGKIGNNLLKDLNFNDQQYGVNHEFNKFQVQNWDYNPFSENDPAKYFYPIVHNGYEYSGDTVNLSGATVSGQTRLYTSTQPISGFTSNAAAYAAGVKRYRLNSPQDGLLDNQLKPALNVKNIIELMFKSYGYTIDSEFFNTPWFKMLYMYGYFSSDSTKFSYKTPVPQTLSIDGVNVVLVETYVDTSEFPCGTQYFRTDRTYNIYVVKAGTGVPCLCSSPINIVLDYALFPCYGGGPNPFTVPLTIPANSTGVTYNWTSNQYVDCGSGCPFSLEYTQNYGLNTSLSDVSESPEPLAYVPVTPNTTLYFEEGDYVDFNLVIDPNLKQIDFLSSIAKKFNLVFIPNPNKPTEIKIEPYSYYIGTGNIYDWTDKISYDKGFTVEPAQNYVESELILTDQEDGDYGNKTFKDQNNRIYGQNFVYNSTDFKSQTKKIDTIFSAELLRQWDTEGTAPNGQIKLPLGINYAASSASQTSGGTEKVNWQYKGVKTKPKLFYNLGFYNPFLDTLGEVIPYAGSVLTNQVYIAASDGANPRGRFVVPIVSHTMPIGNSDANRINNDAISVLFNSEQPVDLGVTPFDVYTENDSYNLFYSNRINNLYNKNTRFINGYFDLKLSDIQNLRANDIIRIKDQYFTWNKIDSFNLTTPELTKVELIQFNNQVNTYPVRYFKYYYCDNPSTVYRFKTDMTNPSLSGTSYGWSVFYDYSIGVLNNAGATPLSGFTSTVRDIGRPSDAYIPYTIYEVSESDYNASGIDRRYDTLWDNLVNNAFDGGDLNQTEWPSYIYALNDILYNLFEDCANFTSAALAYGITTGSSTYYGPPVTPTPTPTVLPTPTPTSTPMIGSLLMSLNELADARGGSAYQVTVNGQIRDLQFTDADNLYSTFISPGNVVVATMFKNSTGETITWSVKRLDYTTDDEGNDMGIKEVIPPFTVNTGTTAGSPTIITLTASTVSNAYNFEYRISFSTVPQPTPTPTPTPTSTPTPTPNLYGGVNALVKQAHVQSSGKYIINGDFTLWNNATSLNYKARISTDGGLDTSYNPTIMFAPTNLWSALLTTDELVNIDSASGQDIITKYNANGNWNGFSDPSSYRNLGYSFGDVWRIWPGSGGKFYVTGRNLTISGSTPNSVLRFNNDLTLDTGFTSPITGTTFTVIGLVEQADGKIVCNSPITGITGHSMIRLNSDGTVDSTFNCNINTDPSYDIKIGPGGKIYYTGYKLGRLNSDGTADTGFTSYNLYSLSGGAFIGNNISVQSDGKCVVTSNGSISYGGNTPSGLFRLDNSGNYDSTFNSGGSGYNNAVAAGLVLSSDKILVYGNFTSYNGTTYNRVMRLNSNGSIDTGFIGT